MSSLFVGSELNEALRAWLDTQYHVRPVGSDVIPRSVGEHRGTDPS